MDRCCNCAKYPFCKKINKPSDEACKDKIKRSNDCNIRYYRKEEKI